MHRRFGRRAIAAARALLLAASLAAAGAGAVAAGADVGWYDFFTAPVNCNGDFVVASGTMHRVGVVADGRNLVAIQFHVSLVASSGTEYVLNWQERYLTLEDWTGYYTSRQLVISKGPGPNMLQTFTFGTRPGPPYDWWEIKCMGAADAP